MKALVNCPNCGTMGWSTVETDGYEHVAVCGICKEQYPLNHKAVETISTKD